MAIEKKHENMDIRLENEEVELVNIYNCLGSINCSLNITEDMKCLKGIRKIIAKESIIAL